jgi:nifR3 family TIM-barrel protein
MEDVSDPPFRALCKKYGADMMYTEFISSEGLIRDAVKSVQKLDIFEYERPIGIQIFGSEISSMREATEMCEKANPDIIDINYGCPVKKVACKGAGAGILQDIPKMVEMTKEIVKSTNLPVTVKTRLGWDENSKYIVDAAERLQDVGIKAISIHGRTRAQMYKGEADWSLISDVKNNPRMPPHAHRWRRQHDGRSDEPHVTRAKSNLLYISCQYSDYVRVHERWSQYYSISRSSTRISARVLCGVSPCKWPAPSLD